MKALLCDCRHYRSEVKKLSTTPKGIVPEPVDNKVTEATEAIVALITVETGDDIKRQAPLLSAEIRKMCTDTGHSNVVLFPFGHLSNKLADSKTATDFLSPLQSELADFNPKRAHFGSNKKLLLDIFGHKGNMRYREF